MVSRGLAAGADARARHAPAPLRRRRLHQEVADRLETAINDGAYGVGDQLPSERALMARFGVGRPAVRQALLSLEQAGLIQVVNGERARVAAPSAQALVGQVSGAARRMLAAPDGVRWFQDARMLFEVGLARHAAAHATAAQIERLRAALAENQRHIGDAAAFNASDVAFHYELAVIPGNPIFVALHAAMIEWLRAQRATSLSHGETAFRHAFAAHQAIHDAIAAHDPDAAERAMQDHLATVAKLYWSAIEQRETQA